MAGRKRRRRTSGLGRKRAHGRGSICVTITKRAGKKTRSHTQCYTSPAAANAALRRAVAGRGEKVRSALIYRRKRRS